MLRTPTFLSTVQRFALAFVLATCLPFLAKADLGITIVTTQNGDELTANILVSNFEQILSMQYALQWNPAELQLLNVGDFNLPSLSDEDFGDSFSADGILYHAWFDEEFLNGVTLPNCSQIYSVTFKVLGNQVSPIHINPDLMVVEVMNIQSQEVPLIQTAGCQNLARVSGKIFTDEDNDCENDVAEIGIEGSLVKLVQDEGVFYYPVSTDGSYYFYCLAGEFDISVILPETHSGIPCQPTYTLNLAENQELVQNLGIQPSETVSSADTKIGEKFAVFVSPNPAQSGQPISIATTTETARALTLQIFDNSGKLLQRSEQQVQPGQSKFDLESSLNAGLYLLKITDENGEGRAVKLVVY